MGAIESQERVRHTHYSTLSRGSRTLATAVLNRFGFDSELCFDILRENDFAFVHKVLAYARRHDKQHSSFPRHNYTSSLNWVRMVALFGRYYLDTTEYQQLMRCTLWRHYLAYGIVDYKKLPALALNMMIPTGPLKYNDT